MAVLRSNFVSVLWVKVKEALQPDSVCFLIIDPSLSNADYVSMN